MKFTKYILALAIAVAALVNFNAQAQTGQSLPFIGQGGSGVDAGFNGYLQIFPGVTNTFNVSAPYAKGSFITNVLTSFTNSANGLVTTGYISQLQPTYVTNASWTSDVRLWGNRDGSAAIANISVDINGLNAAFTNQVTFNFATGGADTAPVNTGAQNAFSFTMVGNGTNDVVLSTNLSQAYLQGNRRLRLTSIWPSTNGVSSGTNGTVVGVWLNGFSSASPQLFTVRAGLSTRRGD